MRRILGKNKLVGMIVVAIMAVLATFTTYGISALTGAKGRDCAEKIQAALERTRIQSMSHAGEYDMLLYLDESGLVTIEAFDGTITAGKYGVTVKYVVSGASAETDLGTKENALRFSFKQNSGSFTGLTYDYINVYANGFVYKLRLYKTTGKVEMNKEAVS